MLAYSSEKDSNSTDIGIWFAARIWSYGISWMSWSKEVYASSNVKETGNLLELMINYNFSEFVWALFDNYSIIHLRSSSILFDSKLEDSTFLNDSVFEIY